MGVYQGESLKPFACTIDGLSYSKAGFNENPRTEGYHSLSSTPAVLVTPRASYGSGVSDALLCGCMFIRQQGRGDNNVQRIKKERSGRSGETVDEWLFRCVTAKINQVQPNVQRCQCQLVEERAGDQTSRGESGYSRGCRSETPTDRLPPASSGLSVRTVHGCRRESQC